MDYAGDITPEAAWTMLSDNGDAVLIDVRTTTEWETVGVPNLESIDKEPLFIEWNRAGGVPNDGFVGEVEAAVLDTDAPVLLLCRSGARSVAAATALTASGYTQVYNILSGFEDPAGGQGWSATLPSDLRS